MLQIKLSILATKKFGKFKQNKGEKNNEKIV